jgi:uncharacterized integral membrane protein (TIGR00698 family)
VSTFVFTTWLGRLIGVDRITQLIAAGTRLRRHCDEHRDRAHDEDVAYTVACITLFGSIAMFTYPLLPAVLQLDPHAFGLWSGASIHEIGQVVAAGFQDGKQAGEFATIAKLSRVMILAPTVICLNLMAARRGGLHSHNHADGRTRPPLPWFILGFIALASVNSVVTRLVRLRIHRRLQPYAREDDEIERGCWCAEG